MPPQPPRYRAAMERRQRGAKASRARLTARAALASARARAAAPPPPGHPARRGFRARPQQQRAEAAGGVDESDSGGSRILDPAGDGGSDAEKPANDDEMAGDVAAILEQPGGLLAQLPGYRVRVRLHMGGLPLAAGLLGQAAVGDPAPPPPAPHPPAPPPPPPPACEHCHTIPYQKGVCCSNVGVRTECPKCRAKVWPKEKDACCGGGRRVLEECYNPPLRAEYKALLQIPHVSYNSRILNSALALGSQGTFPSREHGGLGTVRGGAGVPALDGQGLPCDPFYSHVLLREGLHDGAARDCKSHVHINTRLEGGVADMPCSADVVNSRLRLMSELHVGHSMTYISTSISVTVVDYTPFLYLLNFLHFLAPTTLQLPLYVALAMFLCCYKNVYVAQV